MVAAADVEVTYTDLATGKEVKRVLTADDNSFNQKTDFWGNLWASSSSHAVYPYNFEKTFRFATPTMIPPTVSTKRSRSATSASGNRERSIKFSSRYRPPSTMTDISIGIRTSKATSSQPNTAAAAVQPR